MRRTLLGALAVLGVVVSASVLGAQTRPADRGLIAPGDEIKLDESSALKASAIQSRMSAILANFALLQRQAQDLQQEMTKALEERKRLLEEAARKAKVELREPNEWVYDEAGARYVRSRKNP